MNNNADLMYKYAEKEVESFDKSIDALTSKLTSIVALGGVMMKFMSDLPSSYFKLAIALFIVVAIGAAFIGLFPKNRGCTLRCHAFSGKEGDWWYGCSPEEFQLRIIRQWIIHIEDLEKTLDFRAFWLKASQASLCLSLLLFAFANLDFTRFLK